MAASGVINQQSFHDGKLVLDQLENPPKQLWLCRIKVPNGNGYVYRGTGTSDFYEARKFADELLDELRIKTKLGQSVTGPNLARMADEFETHSRARDEPTNRDLAITAFLKTYAVPYFTKNKITDISAKEIAKFFDWRRANSRRKARLRRATSRRMRSVAAGGVQTYGKNPAALRLAKTPASILSVFTCAWRSP